MRVRACAVIAILAQKLFDTPPCFAMSVLAANKKDCYVVPNVLRSLSAAKPTPRQRTLNQPIVQMHRTTI